MDQLKSLYKSLTGHSPSGIIPLSQAGSNRRYFRMFPENVFESSLIGVVGTSAEENIAFCSLAKEFRLRGINVPEVYAVSDDNLRYIQQDLGDISLFSEIRRGRESGGDYDDREKQLVEKVIRMLPDIQFRMDSQDIYKMCYPLEEMDADSVMFDLNYFKYCYLKLTGIEFNELKLQQDFERIIDDILLVDEYGFQYRDFQARNIMLKDGTPYFIDFQGAREGPIYYDLVSFLWQASSRFSDSFREEMVDAYFSSFSKYFCMEEDKFKSNLQIFVLFRTLQVLGAYGFRGMWERKKHFLDSIPLALKNLRDAIDRGAADNYPYVKELALQLTQSVDKASKTSSNTQELITGDTTYLRKAEEPLVVRVFSFSFKKGIPQDDSGNGGGYVFDCRSTHNPGRYDQYKPLTGLDQPVIDFLEEDGEILQFLDSVYRLADFHVQRFIDRGFTNLMFSFGCTGGRHRSVYSAQHLAEHINSKFGIEVRVTHREQNITQTLPAK